MPFKAGEEWNGNANGRPKTEDSIRASLRRFLLMPVEQFDKYHCKTNAEFIAYYRVQKARRPETVVDDYKEVDALVNQVDGNPNTPLEHNGDGFTLNLGWKKGESE